MYWYDIRLSNLARYKANREKSPRDQYASTLSEAKSETIKLAYIS